MRFIKTKTHGVLDYLVGIILIAAPWIFGFATGGPEQVVPIVIGILMIGMALLTDYEYGAIKAIPMPFHLTMDVIAGIFLAISPWLLGYAEIVFLPHLLVGIVEVFVALTTYKVPDYKTVTH
ncbi:MAG: hypothetical protein HC906_10480 [Bacteroidales bacterium]|nr:hypothetical protein [Bacteroidales bacterium]